ncbi:restriction endonuclease [Campylobacter sp. RM16192]|uniref:restriction endonuclease n=1 Tax=Campylobacter sp. RM16192 TaxID=1660080 RepID=UPI001451A875|nr:restriction endonuclease [Campylobacter sp. RM16192]QCD53355.1 hypothetical protein CDOMC_1771 [Campylobacter sp. RM16192]
MIIYLQDMVDFLRENPVRLINDNDDGRINSATNENIVLDKLSTKFDINIPQVRCWYDFVMPLQNKLFVNVKISDLSNNSADNCSSKLGMGYALCGIENLPIHWEKFHQILANELKTGYDYYFLVVNKNNTSDCFWTSLKRIKTLTSNGNNLPFQCDWSQNRDFSSRSEIEATRYILKTYIESWDKKAKGYPFILKEMLVNNKIFDSE